jgi:cell division ATPase FtsA
LVRWWWIWVVGRRITSYADGVVKQSGCLAIGGDHITNDISMGLRIPWRARRN